MIIAGAFTLVNAQSAPCTVKQGCTGVQTVPPGYVLIGSWNDPLHLTPTATSSLGITGSAGTNFFTLNGVTIQQNTGSIVQGGSFTATSTTATSIFPKIHITGTSGTSALFDGNFQSNAIEDNLLYGQDARFGDWSGLNDGNFLDVNSAAGNFDFSGGRVGISSTTPGTTLSIGSIGSSFVNISEVSTSTFSKGININSGCYAISGTCLSAGISTISIASSNGFGGSSSGGATPALTLTTSVNGIAKGNGTSLSTAANGTDYTLLTAISCTVGNHLSAFTAAGVGTCSADTGGGGGSGGSLLLYQNPQNAYIVATTSAQWLFGESGSTTNALIEISGNLFDKGAATTTGLLASYAEVRAPFLTATSTTATSTFPIIDYSRLASRRFVFEGDSITAYNGTPGTPNTWPEQLAKIDPFFGTGLIVNVAQAGDTMCNNTQLNPTGGIPSEYVSQVQPYKPTKPSDEVYLFIFAGTNDFNDGSTSQQVYANCVVPYLAQARADGFRVVIMGELPSAGNRETQRKSYNALLSGNPQLYDYYVPTDQYMQNQNGILFNGDQLHPSVLGASVIAGAVSALVSHKVESNIGTTTGQYSLYVPGVGAAIGTTTLSKANPTNAISSSTLDVSGISVFGQGLHNSAWNAALNAVDYGNAAGISITNSNQSVAGYSFSAADNTSAGVLGPTGDLDLYDWVQNVSRQTWLSNGNVGISSTTPGTLLSAGTGSNSFNLSNTGTSTFQSGAAGINIKAGCFAVAGICNQAPITLTTSGSSGAATFANNILNIPQYTGGGGGGASYDWLQEANTFGINSLTPTTTIPIEIKSTASSTYAGGLSSFALLSAPYFDATSSATSTFNGDVKIGNVKIRANSFGTGAQSAMEFSLQGTSGNQGIDIDTLGGFAGCGGIMMNSQPIICSDTFNTLIDSAQAGSIIALGKNLASLGVEIGDGAGTSGAWSHYFGANGNDIDKGATVIGTTTLGGSGTGVTPTASLEVQSKLASSLSNVIQVDPIGGNGKSLLVVQNSPTLGNAVNLGIGSTTPGTELSIGSTSAAFVNISAMGSSTYSFGQNILSGCYAILGACIGGSAGSAYAFPLAGNATSTLTQFNGGITAYASSTIGNGAANGGLTVNGNATTTGNLTVGTGSIIGITTDPATSYLGVATSTPDSALDVNGTVRIEGTASVETTAIGGAIVGVGCDTANTSVIFSLSSTTAFVTTPEGDPGNVAAAYTIALNSSTMQTKVCSAATVTPNSVKYIVKIIR